MNKKDKAIKNHEKIGLALAILGGVPIALIGLLFIAFILDIPQPVGGDKLYNDQFPFAAKEHLVIGDLVIGSGYIFPRSGQDIWMRVRTTANYQDDKPLPRSSSNCSPESFKMIQAWFLEQSANSHKLLGIIPISGDTEIDRKILTDTAHLRCGDGGAGPYDSIWPKNKFGQPPIDCTTGWVLYHKQSGFYYYRYSCIH